MTPSTDLLAESRSWWNSPVSVTSSVRALKRSRWPRSSQRTPYFLEKNTAVILTFWPPKWWCLWDFTGEMISKLVDFHGNIIFFHGGCCPKWAVVFQVVAGRVGDSFIWVIFYLHIIWIAGVACNYVARLPKKSVICRLGGLRGQHECVRCRFWSLAISRLQLPEERVGTQLELLSEFPHDMNVSKPMVFCLNCRE